MHLMNFVGQITVFPSFQSDGNTVENMCYLLPEFTQEDSRGLPHPGAPVRLGLPSRGR